MIRTLDSQNYAIKLENEVSGLLTHFNSDFVMSAVRNNIQSRYRFNNTPMVNLSASFEQSFKSLLNTYPESSNDILNVRGQTYKEVLNEICEAFNLNWSTLDGDVYLYTAAYYAYEFFVSNFQLILIDFYTKMILRESDNLASVLDIKDSKKTKETNIIYGKKVVRNMKYVNIAANLEAVLNILNTMTVTLPDIIRSTYTDPIVSDFLCSTITDKGDFFKDFYVPAFTDSQISPVILTALRLNLQQVSVDISDNQE